MSFTPTTVAQLYLQVQNAINGHLDTNTYGQPATWVLSFITDWYSTNPLPFTLGQLKYIGMTPGQMKVAWSQMGGDIDGEATNDTSGVSVSLSDDGTIMAIGADWNDGNTGNSDDNRGHVRVFKYKQFTNDMKDQYHYSNQIQDSNQTKSLIITSKDENGNYVAPENNNFYWTQMGIDIDGEAGEDNSGWSVSLSSDGNIVAIGAYYNDGNGSDSGHVRVYQYTNGSWSKMGDDIDGEAAEDWSGASVSLSSDGTIVAIGARLNDANGNASGHVRVYQYDGSAWVQMGTDIDGEATDDWSGYSVSLSSDGTIVAIGAPGNDGNGNASGHVRRYQYINGTAWIQMGNDIDGEAAFDYSGTSVSLSSDGNIVAIGASRNDGNVNASGHVRVYKYGLSASTLREAGATVRDLICLYNNSEILEAGYTIEQLTVPLFSASELLAAGNTLTDLKNGGTNAAELHEDGYSFDQLRLAGFSAVDCRNANMSNSEIVASGFSITQLREGGISAKRMKNAGYNARELYENGYPVSQLFKAGYSASEIRLAGVDALQARFGGIKNGELKTAGYTVEEYKAASYKASRMKDAGYTRAELEGVYSREELDAAGL